MRLRASHNHVFNFSRIELRRFLQYILNTVGGKIVRSRHVEGPAERFRKTSPGAGDDDSFTHVL